MFLTEGQKCRIGQEQRCCLKGCEWKKTFNHYCWLRPPVIKDDLIKNNVVSFVPAEDTKPFFTRKRKKGRVVANPKKYKEIKIEHKEIKKTTIAQDNKFIEKITIENKDNFTNKITTASQDDWIKKIRVKK